VPAPQTLPFPEWLTDFRSRALAAGIPAHVLDTTLPQITYLPDVVTRDRNQNEFTKTIWDYLDTAVSADRITFGQRALAQNAPLLAEIESAYGVEREVIVAIWGLESAYGGYRGDVPTLSALASLAYDARRSALFEAQLIAALRIIANGEATLAQMRGSWAGAMGHTQFMPTSFLERAVDFRGDGRRDIWSDDPTDALASAAAYLKGFGWITGQPWGLEIMLPDGFDYSLARADNPQPVSFWTTHGVRLIGGRDLPDHGDAVVLLPGGHEGVAFLTFHNFTVLERYNTADAYVVAVGHLADRLRGGPAFAGSWPRQDRALSFDERQELQRLLTAAGFDTRGIDGLIGPRTVGAVREWQAARGLVPDGYAPPRLLEQLRAE
jgi:membrane-bound lytic murein transglycosylase B